MEFVPPGEDRETVNVLYSRGYDGLPTFWCDLDVTFSGGGSFGAWADCVVQAMQSSGRFTNISLKRANGGTTQIIEATEDQAPKMWAITYHVAFFEGGTTIGALTYNAAPEKYDQYRPVVDGMMASFRVR
jgi:hypothetical protein